MVSRDTAALFLFVVGFIASCLTEYYCGTGSENCPIDWSSWYGSNPASYYAGHCGKGTKDAGLGDPMLSVSSLFLVIAIVYVKWEGPLFTPLASVFVGIASFLFHAANTETSSTLDFIGLNLLSPAILADLLRWRGYNVLAFVTFAVFLTAAILVRVLVENSFPIRQDIFNNYIYINQPILAALIFLLAYCWDYIRQLWVGAIFIVGGSATLIVANNVDVFWECVNTQLIEPHFWGHLLVAIGTTLFSRAIVHNGGYSKL